MEELLATNAKEFADSLLKCPAKITNRFSNCVRDVAHILHDQITSRTPVNTGKTLANYQWSISIPPTGVLDAIGSGPVEATNYLALGTESRRPANQAVADASLASLDFSKPFKNFILVNNNPTVGPLEDGEWPEHPFQQRSPNGMFRVSLVYVESLLETGAL